MDTEDSAGYVGGLRDISRIDSRNMANLFRDNSTKAGRLPQFHSFSVQTCYMLAGSRVINKAVPIAEACFAVM
jgi:hypothetical protein